MENEMAKTRIKKEDLVVVISGKDRDLSKPRRVLQVIPSSGRVLVEGANMVKRHTRPNPQRNIKGGILETKKPTRVGSKMLEDGRRIRIAKRSGAPLDK
jgi:large subunit ribosomal protein L24